MDTKNQDEIRIQLADTINKLREATNALLWIMDKLDKDK